MLTINESCKAKAKVHGNSQKFCFQSKKLKRKKKRRQEKSPATISSIKLGTKRQKY